MYAKISYWWNLQHKVALQSQERISNYQVWLCEWNLEEPKKYSVELSYMTILYKVTSSRAMLYLKPALISTAASLL